MQTIHNLNSDFTQRVVLKTTQMRWQPSPSPGVWRKRLDLVGSAEDCRVTSLVRYEPGSRFPTHNHPNGEEILVLEGVFSDEFGDYPVGSFLLNPDGFHHAPFSKEGCVIFVKLRQYEGSNRELIHLKTEQVPWSIGSIPGVEVKPLYSHPDYPEQIRLERWQPGTVFEDHTHPVGEEILVLSGVMEDESGRYQSGTWLRNPKNSHHAPFSKDGCLLYVKTGGFA